MDGITIDHINMSGIMNPISIWLGDRSRRNPDKLGNPGSMQNITISNLTAVNQTTRMTSSITGNRYHNNTLNQDVYQVVKNVSLKNISFVSPGNSSLLDTLLVTLEPMNSYPDIQNLSPLIPGTYNKKYNTMPCYGLFVRHATGISIDNATFSYLNNDLRPVFYLRDVQNLNATSVKYRQPTGNGHLVKATSDTSNIHINFIRNPVLNITQGTTAIANNGTFDFGNVNMLSSSGSISLNVTNTGTAPLAVDQVNSSVTGTCATDFTLDFSALGSSIPPGSSGLMKLVFTPSGAGVRTATVPIVSNDPVNSPYTVNLKGTGVKLGQAITFGATGAKTYGDAPFPLAATASSGLAVAYLSNNTSVATISGNTVTIVGAGATTITASQAGDANYNAADDVAQTLTVNKANQTIAFLPPVADVVSISPNPVEGVLQLNGIVGGIKSNQVVDVTGRVCSPLALERNNNQYQAPVEQLTPGVYLLRILQENKVVQIKFIKK